MQQQHATRGLGTDAMRIQRRRQQPRHLCQQPLLLMQCVEQTAEAAPHELVDADRLAVVACCAHRVCTSGE